MSLNIYQFLSAVEIQRCSVEGGNALGQCK